MSTHPIFAHLFDNLGRLGLLPEPAQVPDVDDRMATALHSIDGKLVGAGYHALYATERQRMADVEEFRDAVNLLAFESGLDLSDELELLSGWHAWHGGL